jgi:hypothetical protein
MQTIRCRWMLVDMASVMPRVREDLLVAVDTAMNRQQIPLRYVVGFVRWGARP